MISQSVIAWPPGSPLVLRLKRAPPSVRTIVDDAPAIGEKSGSEKTPAVVFNGGAPALAADAALKTTRTASVETKIRVRMFLPSRSSASSGGGRSPYLAVSR
jgi:hypothetical protein